jgi:cell division protein FtsQ
VLFLWLLLVAAAGLAFSQSAFFTVRDVQVRGLERVSREELLAVAGVTVPANVFTLDPRAIQERLAGYPPVATVRVERRFPAGLRVDLVERRAVGALPYGQHFLLFDGAGVPFAVRRAEGAADLPLVTGCRPSPVRLGRPASGADLRWVAEVLQNLPSGLQRRVSRVEVGRNLRLTLVVGGGVRAFLGTPEDTGRKLGLLPAILTEAEGNGWSVKEIDLSNPERPFLRRADVAVQPAAQLKAVGGR